LPALRQFQSNVYSKNAVVRLSFFPNSQIQTNPSLFLTAPRLLADYRGQLALQPGGKMTRRLIGFKNVPVLALTTLFVSGAYSSGASAQHLEKESAGRSFPDVRFFATPGKTQDELPEMPRPKRASLSDGQERQGSDDGSARPSGVAPNNFGLAPAVTAPRRLTLHDKFVIYEHQTFGPPALILPAFSAAIAMANPPNHYPRDWRDGGGAYGKPYGDAIARATSLETARFLAAAAFHEDLRYKPSSSTNPLRRTVHALAFTFVDKSDSGRNTIAVSNFAAAAAGGLVGMSYLPAGYNDITHAGQRMAMQFGTLAPKKRRS
jgi:hypothetical protein